MNLEKEKEKAFVQKRAKAAVISRDFALAARLYKSLLREDSGNIGLLSALGSLYVKAGDDKKALLYYEQIRTLSPNSFEALNSMGGIYRRLQRYDESINVLQQALELGLNDTQVNYNLGFTYRSMGAYDEATECFESVIDENPNDVLAYNHLGAIYALRREHQKAVAVYKRGLQVDPNHPILQLNLAKSCEALHDDTNAAAAYEAALRAKPGWLEAIRDYTELLLRHHRTKDAADLVNKSIVLYPDDVGIRNLLGHIYLKQYDYDSAVQTFEKARRLDGGDTDVLSGLAEAYEKSGKVKSAAEVMKKVEQEQPDDAAVTRQYAHVLLSADDSGTAAAKIKKAYDKNRNDVRTLDLCGQYYICRDEDDRADRVYSRINKIDASYEEYKKEASGRYKQRGRLDKARRYLEQYLTKHPEDPSALIALARIDEASGNAAAALEEYHKALKYDQYNVLARREAQRLGDIINETNKQRQENQNVSADEDNGLEIVMEAPEEAPVDSAAAPDSEQEEEPFDFDMMGDSLFKEDDEQDPFAFSDKEDEENEAGEEPQGLDRLIPADQPLDQTGNTKDTPEDTQDIFEGMPDNSGQELSGQGASGHESSGAADQSVPGDGDDGFGAENIDEDPEREIQSRAPAPAAEPELQQFPSPSAPSEQGNDYVPESEDASAPDSRPWERSEPDSRQPEPEDGGVTGESLPDFTGGSSSPDDTAAADGEISKPEQASEDGKLEETPQEQESHGEPAAAHQRADLSDDALDRIAAALNRANAVNDSALSAARETYDAARMAADRAGDAAQRAADSARGAGEAVEYINNKTEDAAAKAAEAAIQKVREAAEKAAAELEEKQKGLLRTNEETSSADTGGTAAEQQPADEEVSPGYDAMIDKAAGILPEIVTMLGKKENTEKFATELELFKKLRALCEYLPPDKKESFMSSRTRLLLDYVIAKLSGQPGLIATAEELRRTKLLSAIFPPDDDISASGGIPDRQLARAVIENMREMVQDLPDAHLAKALDDCAVEALGTL